MKEAKILVCFLVLITFCNTQPGSALEITITDIGTLGGPLCSSQFINNQGQVSGLSTTDLGYDPRHAFVWTEEEGIVDLTPSNLVYSWPPAMNELGQIVGIDRTLPEQGFIWTPEQGMEPIPSLGGPSAHPWDINNLGQVVGRCLTSDTGYKLRAFLWTPGEEIIDLGMLDGGQGSGAYAINDSGQVVGVSYHPGMGKAFSWTAQGGMVSLHPEGCLSSTAVAVNELGQVLVRYQLDISPYNPRAFIWSEEGGMVDIGYLGGGYAYAEAINDLGQVVGVSRDENNKRTLFLWSEGGGMVAIGDTLLTSNIAAINNLGQIAFTGRTANEFTMHAYIWTEQDGSQLLGELGDESYAYAINDRGQVAGYTRYAELGVSVSHATLWTFQTILPPDQHIDSIIDRVEILIDSGTLNQGQGNALNSKLEAAKNQLDKENETAVCNLLQAFTNQVQAYINSERLTLEEGQALIDEANNIISELCG